jgi:RNA polymerase sigma-70 factor (ECF subfamily)
MMRMAPQRDSEAPLNGGTWLDDRGVSRLDALAFQGALAAARLGEGWAVGLLWRDLHPRILRYLRVAVGDSDAEDVASDVWLEVARGLGRFDGDESAFRAWVFTIARRRVIDAGRKVQRRRTDPISPQQFDRVLPDAPDELEARLALDAALRRVARLPRDQAEVVALRVLAGLSAEQVAEIVGKSAGAIRVLQHRGLRRLANELAAEGVTRQTGAAIFGVDEPLTA